MSSPAQLNKDGHISQPVISELDRKWESSVEETAKVKPAVTVVPALTSASVIIQDRSTQYEEEEEEVNVDVQSPSVIYQQMQRSNNIDTSESAEVEIVNESHQKTMTDKDLSVIEDIVVSAKPSQNVSQTYTGGHAGVPTHGEDVTPGELENEDISEVSVMESKTTAGRTKPEVEMGDLRTTPGGEDAPGSSDLSDYAGSDEVFIIEKDKGIADKPRGDCYRLYIWKFYLTLFILIVLALLIVCFVFWPTPLDLCLKLSLNDQDIMDKLLDDEGGYDLKITNPNSIDIDIHGLEIKAYYGGVAEENWLINAEGMDYHIPALSTWNTSNQTYTFTQDCTAAVPISTLNGCSVGYRKYIPFELVTSFEACLLSFICHEVLIESEYESNCPEDDWVCTEVEIFQF